jgi:hypothetical protein
MIDRIKIPSVSEGCTWGWVRTPTRVPRWGPRLQRANEPVAAARQRFHKTRIVGIVAERLPEPLHGGIEAVLEIDERAIRPEPPLQLVTGHDVARPLEHHAEDFEWLLLQPDPAVAVVKLSRTEVQLERSEADAPRVITHDDLSRGVRV